MNNRVKDLMLEAGYAAPEIADRANKLAELIIKECCRAISDSHSWKSTTVAEIHRHFGIEE